MPVQPRTLVSDEQAIAIQEEAQAFLSESNRWESMIFAARTAVSEYIANTRGLTFYRPQTPYKS